MVVRLAVEPAQILNAVSAPKEGLGATVTIVVSKQVCPAGVVAVTV